MEDLLWHLEHDVSLERFERWARDVGIRDEDLDRDLEVARQIAAERRRMRARENREFSWRKRVEWERRRERPRRFWMCVTWAAGIAGAVGIAICILYVI